MCVCVCVCVCVYFNLSFKHLMPEDDQYDRNMCLVSTGLTKYVALDSNMCSSF